jgi:Fe-S cluster assembly protein SufD
MMGVQTVVLSAGEQALLDLLPDTEAGAAARESLAASGLPNRRNEAFKWSDLRAAIADGIGAASGDVPELTSALSNALIIDFAPDGVGIEGEKGEGLIIEMADSLAVPEAGPVAAIAAALAPRMIVLKVTKSQALPVVLRRHPGAPMRVRVEMAEGTALTLVDLAEAAGGLSTSLIEAIVPEHAVLTRISLQRGGDTAVDLNHAAIMVEPGGSYGATALAFGGKFARAETFVTLAGLGAKCRIDGAYLLNGTAHADATTRVHHTGPGGETRELFKGTVSDKARGVFQGKILVDRAAQQTDARQNHHALMLSEGCEVDAKPELEIYADDVACAHGNTIGALDEQALFYMRQRGIPLAQARALLVQAFIGEVFDTVDHEGARDWLSGLAAVWLEGQGG